MRWFLIGFLLSRMCSCISAQDTYEAVDLGLSVKWAVHNMGAKSASDYGSYYAWGEIKEKTKYWFDTYEFADTASCEQCLMDLGVSICETEYDVARQLWKGEWRLPTDKEILELRNNCTWEWTSLDGINGFMVTGPNGNRIFLPAGGEIIGEKNESLGNTCSYWGGTKSFVRNAHTISAFYDEENDRIKVMCWGDFRPFGRLVRPVTDKPE